MGRVCWVGASVRSALGTEEAGEAEKSVSSLSSQS